MFNVGDVVLSGYTEYTVDTVRGSLVTIRNQLGYFVGEFHENNFTLVTPPKPVLTGMTQFLKDIGDKYAT